MSNTKARQMKISEVHEHNKSLNRQLNVLTYKRLGMVYISKGIKVAIKNAKVEGNVAKVKKCSAIFNGLTSSIQVNKRQSSTLRKALR